MTCTHCGAGLAAGATFCPACGEMVLETPATPPPAPAPPAPEPKVVPVPQRPTRQSPPRTRTRQQVPPPRAPQQSGYRVPPGYQQPGYQQPRIPQGYPQPGYQQPRVPQGYPQQARRRRGGGCGTMLMRLMMLVIGLPIALTLLGSFLGMGPFGTGSSDAAPTSVVTSEPAWPGNDPTVEPSAVPPTVATTPTAATTDAAASAPTTSSASPSASSGVDEVIESALGTAAPSAGAAGAYPAVTLTGRECARTGSGAYAATAAGNAATTCSFAVAAQKAYLTAGGAGRDIAIRAYSQARGTDVALTCTGAQPARCASSAGALVYLYGGTATFR